jgi:hypothetical protein
VTFAPRSVDRKVKADVKQRKGSTHITDLQNGKVRIPRVIKRIGKRVDRVRKTWFCRNGIHDGLEVKMWCKKADLMVSQTSRKKVSFAFVKGCVGVVFKYGWGEVYCNVSE